jgi:hypothetical protein
MYLFVVYFVHHLIRISYNVDLNIVLSIDLNNNFLASSLIIETIMVSFGIVPLVASMIVD